VIPEAGAIISFTSKDLTRDASWKTDGALHLYLEDKWMEIEMEIEIVTRAGRLCIPTYSSLLYHLHVSGAVPVPVP
jgi:hypothetical protein